MSNFEMKKSMNLSLANDLVRYAELVEDEALISPEEMNCASLMRLAAEALAQPEHKPVACVQDLDEVKRKHLVYEKGMDWKDPLYTTPPQRKPLTDDEIERLRIEQEFDKWAISEGAFKYAARAVEAAHGIKE